MPKSIDEELRDFAKLMENHGVRINFLEDDVADLQDSAKKTADLRRQAWFGFFLTVAASVIAAIIVNYLLTHRIEQSVERNRQSIERHYP